MKRREFLQSGLLAARVFCIGLPALAKHLSASGDVKLRAGILSDIHIRGYSNVDVFKRALEYFRNQGADAGNGIPSGFIKLSVKTIEPSVHNAKFSGTIS